MFSGSIDVDSPHSHKTKKVIIDILFKCHSICIHIPEILASCLHSLSFLTTQNNLNDVLVSFFTVFFETGFDGVSYILAERVEVVGWVALFGDEFLLKNSFDEVTCF